MSKRAILVIAAGSIILLFGMGLRYSFGLFLKPVSDTLMFDIGVFSLAIAIQNLLWGISQPFAGAIAEKYGSGKVIASAGVLHVIGLVILANADGAGDLYAGAGVFLGLAGSGSTFALILAVVARNVPAHIRSTVLGLTAATGTLGQISMAPMTQYFLSNIGWSSTFIIWAVILGALIPLAVFLTGKSDGSGPVAVDGAGSLTLALNEVRRHRSFWYLNAGFFVCGFHVMFIMAHFPNFLASEGFPEWLAVWAIAVIGVANMISTVIVGWLGDRYSKKYLLSGLYLARAAVFALFLMVPVSVPSVLIFVAAIGSLWLATVPLTSGLVGQIYGVRYLATLFGIVFMSHQFGSFCAVWLGGYVFDATGSYDLIWQISIALGLISALFHLPIAERPLTRNPTPAPA